MLHLRILGFVFLALAVLALILPLVPATPMLLLSAACFARSSEKWHNWLLDNPNFGPMVRRWEDQGCITRRVKITAVLSMLVLGSFSVFFAVQHVALKLIGVLMIGTGCLVLMRIPTCNCDQ